jgi:enamine deaminase RidA (YjgF/YER057c/UK114 family)
MRILPALALIVTISLNCAAQLPERKKAKKKKKEQPEITQTLEVLPDPPVAITAETAKLSFYQSPLSAKGLLTQQTRDALKAVRSAAHGAAIVKIRAFVAGTGDLRRVASLVAETFSEGKLPIPAVSTILVGALPLDGAQIVMEATAQERKNVNPAGVAFFSGQLVRASEEKPRPLAEVAGESIANLEKAIAAAGTTNENLLRATCYVSVLDNPVDLSTKLTQAFPKAAINLVQLQRVTGPSTVECEGVGRLVTAPAQPVEFLNPDGLEKSPNYTQITRVNAAKLVLTTTQQSFGLDDAAMRLAMSRLQKMLDSQHAAFGQVVMAHGYALSNKAMAEYRRVRGDFYDKAHPPASTLLVFEGLPSSDAVFGLDVIAALP